MSANMQLEVIEQAADEARQRICEHLMAYGCLYDTPSSWLFDPEITLSAAAALVTGGPVEPCANLVRRGNRLAGVLEWVGQTPFIFYEAYDLGVRQRFSIAHELGHFCLHVGQREHCQCNQATIDPDTSNDESLTILPRLEQEADAFAAALLMPEAQLREDAVFYGHSLAFLAMRYRVSEPAMRRRLRRLERE